MKSNLFNKNGNLLPSLKKYWHIFVLMGFVILSFWLNFYAISKIGYGNAYYAAAIRSMTQSFKNFFFISFDPAGTVSVDKPPLALWVQAIFVMIFGYHGWAMLLPQALAGTGSCILIYVLIAKYFGRPAVLISALVFALTPAVVVASRNNTMDMQLIFVLLVSTWFLFKGIEKSKWRYLFLAAFFVGLGFNIKMLQAYMILPTVGLVYLLFSKETIRKRILASVISIVIILVVSFSWVLAVDLYPSNSRPYVGSSTNNTVTELIIGHNGIERLSGQGGGGGRIGRTWQRVRSGPQGTGGQGGPQGTSGQPPQMGQQSSNAQAGGPPNQNSSNNNTSRNNGQPNTTHNKNRGTPPSGGQFNQGGPGGGQGRGNGARGGVGNDIGTAGALRLWTSSLYGQATWLIILALFCITACIRKFNMKKLTLEQGVFAYWCIWLITMCIFFSFASFYHRYYLCMVAPGIAGLVGIGITQMYKEFRDKRGWQKWLLPLSLLATSGVASVYVWSYSALRTWLVPLIIVTAIFSLGFMAIHYVSRKKLALIAATGLMLISILAGPFYWTLTAVMYVPENSTMPYAGPELASTTKTVGMTANQETYVTADSATLSLEKYLVSHYKKGSYLVVSQKANDVAGFIVDTGLPAVAYGGFLGSDNSISLAKLKSLVKEGKITYFLISGQSGFNSNAEITSYVKANATLIDPSEYGGTISESNNSSTQFGSFSNQSTTLYCFK